MTEQMESGVLGWQPEDLRIDLVLADVMADLDPGWVDWAGLAAVGA